MVCLVLKSVYIEMGSFREEFSEEKICFLCISVPLDFSLFCLLWDLKGVCVCERV